MSQRFDTLCVHSGSQQDPVTGAVVSAIQPAVTFRQLGIGKPLGFEYSRAANPSRRVLERSISELEGYKHSVCFGSGIAAELALFQTLKQYDHVLFCEETYGGTFRLMKTVLNKFGLRSDFVQMDSPDRITDYVTKDTKMVFVESPTNPLLDVIDLQGVGEVAKKHGLLYVVDNTLLSPAFQQPKKFGADVVVHSTSKYLAGHNDVVGGSLSFDDASLQEKLGHLIKATGAVLSPFECYLTLRGIKTLYLRMQKHEANHEKIAAFLERHPKVKRVYSTTLSSHPKRERFLAQATGHGGTFSFELKGGLASAKKFVRGLSLWTFGESLGGVESLVSHPPTMSHSSLSREERLKRGIHDGLLRLSCGIENADDLISDLEEALAGV
ncbi:MAG TPA: aminotransferase class I/II-fold pyridoxal phosphate-dependent enzyme [Candidatus Diapherotrites archaeon]|uniref:Aminotransferase class I/II-fold pyridoxal phosphate-dependent enzyme n=1 Tax=Candidatus Iainarchaeum sp. TaxID=3101447 RepID=A0A7J4JK15_9ARCH|nr:aminotransferase class I/II-fold pyridoxal phosphate-dependent enzyme [Candidatus Diapherotrites archaeon]